MNKFTKHVYAEEMMALRERQYDPEMYKKALDKLLKLKTYHISSPTKKNEMLMREYNKILNKVKEQNKK